MGRFPETPTSISLPNGDPVHSKLIENTSGEKFYASIYRMNMFSVALDLIPQISCGVTKTNDRFTVKYSLRIFTGTMRPGVYNLSCFDVLL